ncbi:MAG TPA: biotin carboxylase N-terminal domain-containing protein [Streptosporangiaceae bacterium]
MFRTVLIANRGEIAVRITRTLRRLAIRSVVTCTAQDAAGRAAAAADAAVLIGSYLSVDDVIGAARRSGAEAVHPGYGFLAENPALARACAENGLVFVGPPPDAIAAMGDKIAAKRTVAAAGVPVVPGSDDPSLTDAQLAEAALAIGLAEGHPVLLKPSAGGGGKGMRLVRDPAGLGDAIAGARREAVASFGDGTLLAERFITSPRHIEIQVFADAHGHAVHLGERECSLQRRHQKIIEEAPSPLLAGGGESGARTRAAMGASAVAAAQAVGYTSAGTVEYIVSADRPDEYFFMEMNTRLQVEHPVTELAVSVAAGQAGPLDLVELQLRVAAGEPLPMRQEDVRFSGHAAEARVYAEDPARGFLPTGGRVLRLAEPGLPSVRVDSGLTEGSEVGGGYDPMLAKVIACGPDRPAALRRLDQALASYTLLGVRTNVAFLRALLADPQVQAGRLDTGLAERLAAAQHGSAQHGSAQHGAAGAEPVPDEVLAAAALDCALDLETAAPGPWQIPDGWRPGGPAWTRWPVAGRQVAVRGRPHAAEVAVGDADPVPAAARRDGDELVVSYGGAVSRFTRAADGPVRWLGRDGHAWALDTTPPPSRRAAGPQAAAGAVRSPMPGTVQAVKTTVGEDVLPGQPLVVVEAMKMEHTVVAPVAGTVTELPVRAGALVALDQVLAVISAAGGPEDELGDREGKSSD